MRGASGPGGLWPLLIPVVCCGGPPLAAGLAAAGALAWGGLGLAVLLAGALLIIRQRRRARAADSVPEVTGQVSISWAREGTRNA